MATAIQRGLLITAFAIAVEGGIALPAFAQIIEGFKEDYSPNNWQLFNDNADGKAFLRDTEGNLSIFTSEPIDPTEVPPLSPDSLFLLGGNQAEGADCGTTDTPEICLSGFTTFLFVGIQADSLLSFHWNYQTEDADPGFDPFRYVIAELDSTGTMILPVDIVDLVEVGLDAPSRQQGTTAVEVKANQLFGFQIRTLDNQFGAASVLIDRFKAILKPQPCETAPDSDPEKNENCPPDPSVSVPEPGVAIATLLVGIGLLKLRRKPTR